MAQSINEMNMKKSQPGTSTNLSQTYINNDNSNTSVPELLKSDAVTSNLNVLPNNCPNGATESTSKTNFQENVVLPLVEETLEFFQINSQNITKPFQVDPILNEINVFLILKHI